MLVDASVARSFAVLEWIDELARTVGGTVLVAHGVIGAYPGEPCELLGIRNALQREANSSRPGSGRASKAIAAVNGLDCLLRLGPSTVQVLMPDANEVALAVRLNSNEPAQREWRCLLGLRARRLDAGEATSIAIAHHRGLDFASDDEQALLAFQSLTGRAPARTLDLIKRVVERHLITDDDGRDGYRFLQQDDLHLLGGPDW